MHDCGDTHVVALTADGGVVAWGTNTAGESHPPSGLADIRSVAAGAQSSAALRADGTVVCWGGVDKELAVPVGIIGVTCVDVRMNIVAVRAPPTGDFNFDAVVSGSDLTALLVEWATSLAKIADMTGDGLVNAADLAALLARWGTVP
jgi:alpha-tubulin suppressor-like RCC1 family protein